MNKRELSFYIVDVFAEKRYAGNQLAVFCGDMPDEREMQQIAREMNFAETTFILDVRGDENRFPVRIFTPESEVPFAGHPTLGTAHVLREVFGKGIQNADGNCSLSLNLKAGMIPVTWASPASRQGRICPASLQATHSSPDMTGKDKTGDIYQMTQRQPEFGAIIQPAEAAAWLGLELSDIDPGMPVQWVSTGLPFLIAPLRSLDAVRRARLAPNAGHIISSAHQAAGILLFAREGREPGQDLSVRVFVDELGVPEDPATGSGNGCLAAWLLKHAQELHGKLELISGQGHEIGRPSTIFLKAEKTGNLYDIHVGGSCRTIAHGRWVAE